jgi:hypothetical protein
LQNLSFFFYIKEAWPWHRLVHAATCKNLGLVFVRIVWVLCKQKLQSIYLEISVSSSANQNVAPGTSLLFRHLGVIFEI